MQGRKMYRWGRAKTPSADAVARRAVPCADTVAPWRIAGLATLMVLLPVAAWACAVCFDGDDALARGLNVSILFLLSMPYAIVGTICSTVYIRHTRARRHGSKGLAGTQKAGAQ
jgi:hypothetical protein